MLIHNTFAESLSAEQAPEGTPAWRREPMYSLSRTEAVLAEHPKLATICNTVAAHPNVRKWLRIRGVQRF